MCGDTADVNPSLTPALDSVLNNPNSTEDNYINEKENKDFSASASSTRARKTQRVRRPLQQDLRVAYLLPDSPSGQSNLHENAVCSLTEALDVLNQPDDDDDNDDDDADWVIVEPCGGYIEDSTAEELNDSSLDRRMSLTDALDSVLNDPDCIEDVYSTVTDQDPAGPPSRAKQTTKKQRISCPVQPDLRAVLGLGLTVKESTPIPQDASFSLTEAMDALAKIDQDLLEEAQMLVEEQRIEQLIGGASKEQMWNEKAVAEAKVAEADAELAKLQEALATAAMQVKEAQGKAQQQLQAAAEKAKEDGVKANYRKLEQFRSRNAFLQAEIAQITVEIDSLEKIPLPLQQPETQADLQTNGCFGDEDSNGRSPQMEEEITKQREANAKLKVMLEDIKKEITWL